MDDLKRTINLASFLPPVSKDSKDMQELMRIENVELQNLWDAMGDIFYNQFIVTMTEYGLHQWETIFDIMPKANESLADRRNRILLLLMTRIPYTMRSFQSILDKIYGMGNVTIHVDNERYEFWMDIASELSKQSDALREFVEIIVPKNLLIGTFVKLNKKLIYTGARIGAVQSDIYLPPPDHNPGKAGEVYCGGRIICCCYECTLMSTPNQDTADTIYGGGKIVYTRQEYIE